MAATLARAGFEIEFEDEDDRSTTHCEFTAMFKRTGRKELAFGKGPARILIGNRYQVEDDEGRPCGGVVTTAIVSEPEKAAICGVTLDNGKSQTFSWPPTDAELAAWKRHPDTFFGEVGQRTTTARNPLELYDFFVGAYEKTPRERLLELVADHPDVQELRDLDQPSLVKVYAERCAYAAINAAENRGTPATENVSFPSSVWPLHKPSTRRHIPKAGCAQTTRRTSASPHGTEIARP